MSDTERFSVDSDKIVQKVKQLIHEGNVRRVRLLRKNKTLIDIPLTVGAPAAVAMIIWLPVLAAIAAFTALISECAIEVERTEDFAA